MEQCKVIYHREETDNEKGFEEELDSLMNKHGLYRLSSGCAVMTHMRNIAYEKDKEE